MPTPGEKKALLFFGTVALLGVGTRVEQSRRPPPPPTPSERAALKRQIARVDSAAAAGEVRRPRARRQRGTASSPPAAPVRIDMDRATAEEIERLPRIGPALAARIVANRDSLGPFGSLEALDRVKGIGPAMLRQLSPHVTFTLSPRPVRAPLRNRSRQAQSRKSGG